MRAETLADAEVVGFLNEHFVIAWSNLLPELYGTADPDAPPPSYPEAQTRNLPEGAGGGNIRAYFCTPGGEIVHQALGLWRPRRFLAEARFALALPADDPKRLAAAQAQHQHELNAEWEQARQRRPAGADWSDPAVRRAASCGVRVRSAEELRRDLLADVEAVIDRRREEVYTKGAVG